MTERVTVSELVQFKVSVDGQITQTKTGFKFTCDAFTCEHHTIGGLGEMVIGKIRANMAEQWIYDVMGG